MALEGTFPTVADPSQFEFQSMMWKLVPPHMWAAFVVFGWYTHLLVLGTEVLLTKTLGELYLPPRPQLRIGAA